MFYNEPVFVVDAKETKPRRVRVKCTIMSVHGFLSCGNKKSK